MPGSTSGAEGYRLRLAEAWGSLGGAWGLPPAVARVHGYLLASRGPRTEREVRAALDLSHRAASMALERTAQVGLTERVAGRRVGARGPVGVAYRVVLDDWAWLGRVLVERRATEVDPALAAVAVMSAEVAAAAAADPGDAELAALAAWLRHFEALLLCFQRAIGIVAGVEPRELEALVAAAGAVPEKALLRLVRLLAQLSPDEIVSLADSLGRLPPKAVRPAVKALGMLGGHKPEKAEKGDKGDRGRRKK